MEFGAVAVWWAVLVGLGAAGLPLAALVFRPLPDRGVSLALPTALVVVFVPVYWIGHLRFGPAVVAVAVVLLAGLSVLASRRSPPIDRRRTVETAVVFTLAFLLVVAIRAVDPSIVPGGGEKFLDYGLIQTLQRAETLPPEDFWFAGERVAYYYGGHILAGSLSWLTDTPAQYAFNLALAGFYATLVSAAYGLAGSIAASRGLSYRAAGAAAAFFVGIASNLVPPLQAILLVLPDGVATPIATAVADRTADAVSVATLTSTDAMSYWTASRVIPGTINEFPLFSFLNGDLHPHAMSPPFLLLVAGVGFAYALTPREDTNRRLALVFGAAPVLGGMLAVVNTWSFPSAVGLVALAVLFADAPPADLLPARATRYLPDGGGIDGEATRLGVTLLVTVVVGLLGVVWALPFFLGPVTGGPQTSIGVLPPRSGLVPLLLVHGWFLLLFGWYLWGRAGAAGLPVGWKRFGVAAAVAIVILGLIVQAAAVALVLPILALAWVLLRRDADVGYEAVLFVAGAGLVLLVEFVFLDEMAGPGRFNTVFKAYMQVWVLWAVGAGVAVVGLLAERRSVAGAMAGPLGRLRDGASGTTGGRSLLAPALVALLVLSLSLYGVGTLGVHFHDAPEPTLDGTTWASTYHPYEWQAIDGFVDGLSGQPTIVTAPGCWCNPDEVATPYRWANAPSTYTGVPTVVGWQHEVGYRGWDAYLHRYEDVKTIYTGPREERTRLLAAYDVSYVYVGPNERAIYDDITLSGAPELTLVFENQEVTIYEVDRSQL